MHVCGTEPNRSPKWVGKSPNRFQLVTREVGARTTILFFSRCQVHLSRDHLLVPGVSFVCRVLLFRVGWPHRRWWQTDRGGPFILLTSRSVHFGNRPENHDLHPVLLSEREVQKIENEGAGHARCALGGCWWVFLRTQGTRLSNQGLRLRASCHFYVRPSASCLVTFSSSVGLSRSP